MSVKPVLFSAPMVKAILAGRKTQTRRALSPQPSGFVWRHGWDAKNGATWTAGDGDATESGRIRWWAGDLLYAREAWRTETTSWDSLPPNLIPRLGVEVLYAADADWSLNKTTGRERRAMHMPRWASRITLLVEDVRVERLQEISHRDATAEGLIEEWEPSSATLTSERTGESRPLLRGLYRFVEGGETFALPRDAYAALWNSINGTGSYEANQWVVALTFRPILANVDAVLADPAAYGLKAAA